jgi:hypothetical protein
MYLEKLMCVSLMLMHTRLLAIVYYHCLPLTGSTITPVPTILVLTTSITIPLPQVWFSGLRGAVAYASANLFPDTTGRTCCTIYMYI